MQYRLCLYRLLSGILHLNRKHIGFSAKEVANVGAEVFLRFYSQDMEDKDMQRAAEAVTQWTNWVQVSFDSAFAFDF